MKDEKYDYSIDIADFSTDGRLTEPSDGQKYDWKKMIEYSIRVDRPLTVSESSDFIVSC